MVDRITTYEPEEVLLLSSPPYYLTDRLANLLYLHPISPQLLWARRMGGAERDWAYGVAVQDTPSGNGRVVVVGEYANTIQVCSRNIQGTCKEHARNIQGTFKEHTAFRIPDFEWCA